MDQATDHGAEADVTDQPADDQQYDNDVHEIVHGDDGVVLPALIQPSCQNRNTRPHWNAITKFNRGCGVPAHHTGKNFPARSQDNRAIQCHIHLDHLLRVPFCFPKDLVQWMCDL